MRVQRTRSASLRSPLTRDPLGDLVATGKEHRAVHEAPSVSSPGSLANRRGFRSSEGSRQDQRRNRHRGVGFVAR